MPGRLRLLSALIATITMGAALVGACGGNGTSPGEDAAPDAPGQQDGSMDAIVDSTRDDETGTSDVAMTGDSRSRADAPPDSPIGESCVAGSLACYGTQPLVCPDAGTWQNANFSCGGSTPGCFQGMCVACQPGEQVCDGNAIITCAPDGSGWSSPVPCPNQTCSSSAVPCGNETCLTSVCIGVCPAGTTQCTSGSALRTCDSMGQWGPSSACPLNLCLAGSCAVCSPGATTCSGTQPQQCDSSGVWQNAGPPCSQPNPDCSQGACTCAGTMCNAQCVHPLTDDHNCGGCGILCNGTCMAGHCQETLAQADCSVAFLRVNATNVYFNGGDPESIITIPVGGGTPSTIYVPTAPAGGYPSIADMDIDSANVYWTAQGPAFVNGVPTLDNGVFEMPLGGGSVTTLAVPPSNDTALAVRAFGSSVYWTTATAGAVLAVPVAGGPSTVLYPGEQLESWDVAANGSTVFWTSAGNANGAVRSMPVAGGAITTIASGTHALHIALDAANVYWGDTAGLIMQAPLSGGPPITLATNGQYGVEDMALDATRVYWTTSWGTGNLTVSAVPIGGGTVTTYVSTSVPVYGAPVAVDATYIYWAYCQSPGFGYLMRVAK